MHDVHLLRNTELLFETLHLTHQIGVIGKSVSCLCVEDTVTQHVYCGDILKGKIFKFMTVCHKLDNYHSV